MTTLHPKVAASLIAGYLTVIIVYSLHQWAGIDLPDTVSAAVTGIVAAVAGWFAPTLSGESVAAASDPAPPAA